MTECKDLTVKQLKELCKKKGKHGYTRLPKIKMIAECCNNNNSGKKYAKLQREHQAEIFMAEEEAYVKGREAGRADALSQITGIVDECGKKVLKSILG